MSSFKVNTDTFKKALQLIKTLVAQKDSHIVFEIMEDNCLLVKCGTDILWLEQSLKTTEATIVKETSIFAIPFEILQKFKFSGKEIYLKIENSQKGASKIWLISGNFKGSTICTNPKKALINNMEKIKLTHSFNKETFTKGLSLLSFKPVATDTKSKIVRVYTKDKKCYLSTNDSFRGGYYSADFCTSDIDTTIDFSFIMSALLLFSEDTLQIGFSAKQTRVQCGSVDLQCARLYQVANSSDITNQIALQRKGAVKCAFDIKAKDLKTAIKAISGILNSEEEIRIYIELISGKEVKKGPDDKDNIKVYTRGETAYSSYSIPIDNVEGQGKFSVSSGLIIPLLIMDDFIRLSFYQKVLVLESLKYELVFCLPQLAVAGKES